MLAFACKRLHRWEETQDAFELLLAEFPDDLTARLELAKLYEHRLGDLERAEKLCVDALDQLERQAALSRPFIASDTPAAAAFRHRLERIRRKRATAERHGEDDLDLGED